MNSVAIITARGGSKRIPRKNIKDFLGKPILIYSIETALDSNAFDEVMVSTDDDEIADVALRTGAKVPFRRSERTANDYATTSDVLMEVLEEYEKRGVTFDSLCCIYPTAPFVTVKKIVKAMNILDTSNADSVIPVVPFSFPPQRGFTIEKGYLSMPYPENLNVRSQDLPTMYHDCGQFYCAKVKSFQKYGKLIMPRSVPFIMSELEVQDIDNETDWKLAELKYKMMET